MGRLLDHANLAKFNFEEIPIEKFVMTAWRVNELLKDVFWFLKNNTFRPNVDIKNTLQLHISKSNMENKLESKFESTLQVHTSDVYLRRLNTDIHEYLL